MIFTRPLFLLLLLAVGWLWWAQRRSLADLGAGQRRLALLVRALLLAALALALAGPRVPMPVREGSVIYLLDESPSLDAVARQAGREFIRASLAAKRGPAGVVVFGAEPRLLVAPSMQAQLPETWPEPDKKPASDLGRALDFASALFPASGSRRVVLLSDGRDTASGAQAAASRLAAAGIELQTVALANAAAPEVLVERVDVPRRLKLGEPFDLTARIRSNTATKAKARLYQNQFLLEERALELRAGMNEFRAPSLQPDGSFATYELEVLPEADTRPENNRAQATASLRGQPRVLLVEGGEGQSAPLASALRAGKMQVETRAALGAPRTLEDLQQFDLFLLSDVSALGLSREQMELYRRWVRDFGGGFVMLGGENSYGVGGFFRTPIEQMLPVRMEHDDRQDLPSVALLIVLDRSGSMAATVQGATKMSLANQGAAIALGVLQPRDYFGVLAVDTRPHVVAPLARQTSRAEIEQKILSVTAGGGGIYIYTSLAESFQQLRDIPARIKHVILFSDASDAEEKAAGEQQDGSTGSGSALDLAAAMLTSKITTSVVALGAETDKDTAFLRQLAERGSGRFYLTSDATTLPQIFTTETMKVAQSSMIEEPFQPAPVAASPLTAGVDWKSAPLLLGYNATKPKPGAETPLATERGEPLLATWRYGLGQSAAFTSDAKARWASEWLGWAGYGKFWAQLARGLMRKSEQAGFQVDVREEGARLVIELLAVKPDGAFRNQLAIAVNAQDADGATRVERAVQTGPGTYRAEFPLAEEGTTLFSVASPDLPDGGISFGHTRPYPREFVEQSADEPLLRQLAAATGGVFSPTPEAVWAAPEKPARGLRDLTDPLLMAALLLLPLDIFLRRWQRRA